VAARLFGSPLDASVTRIESFAACPFKHFARYGLGLRERPAEDGVSALDLGNVFHAVLERVVGEMVRRRQRWQDVPPGERREMIREVTREVGERLRGEVMLSSARNRYLMARVEQTLEEVAAGQAAAGRRGAFAPAFAELGFGGSGDPLPGFEVATPGGRRVVLQGKIDRVDVLADDAAFAVIDYKLHGSELSLARVYHGLSLQLLTYLLVLREGGERLTGRRMTPAAAFYVRLLRQLEECKHPDDLECEGDPSLIDLRVKPRGIFEASRLGAIDATCVKGQSQVVNAFVKADGTHGNRRSSDAAEAAEFAALLEHARLRIGELADQILDGRIGIAPFMMRGATPCPKCEFKAVCRFDAAINRYQHLEPMGREDVLKRVAEGRP
jgi:ATP-dependent helicase/nuclease subunit B